MRSLLVTLLLALLSVFAGCTSYVNPITGTTLSGGVPAAQSRLLGVRLPSGMAFYPEHSRVSGTDGMEIVRGDASPALCAQVLTNGLREQGWSARLASAANTRACYAYEKDGRLAIVSIFPQTATTMTLVTIYTSSSAPADIPLPTARAGFASSAALDASGSGSEPSGLSAEPMSTEPLSAQPAQAGSTWNGKARDL